MIDWIAAASCLLAAIPTLVFLRNLALYAPLPKPGVAPQKVSVLIPARNEKTHIAAVIRSVLKSVEIEFELIVLDDHSTDGTAEIVREFGDPRVRLETAAPLPRGWGGKNFACHQLAALAAHPLLVFLDADVRLSRPDSLARLAAFVEESDAALVSGIPRQETRGFLEKLIIPLIHFILLGFLPLRRMRAGTDPHFAAACGQVIAVRRCVYEHTGGHERIADRLHDGIALARNFRSHGFKTDLFDATDSFACRMYQSGTEVWNGFAKNAHEGLGAPRLIGPATLLLLGGQVLPLCLLALTKSPVAIACAALATALAFLPRLISISRFRQSLLGAILHPLGIIVLVAIQWCSFFRSRRRGSVVWKGRTYSPMHPA